MNPTRPIFGTTELYRPLTEKINSEHLYFSICRFYLCLISNGNPVFPGNFTYLSTPSMLMENNFKSLYDNYIKVTDKNIHEERVSKQFHNIPYPSVLIPSSPGPRGAISQRGTTH